jgi:substrate import-associated zinc metallohydrolase lipoprotein
MMKKIMMYTFSLLLTLCGACGEDGLSPESVIVDSNTTLNAFDAWLLENYNKPYNIDFIYRADDRQYSMDHTLAPPKYEHSVAVAKILQHLWLGTYNDVKGVNFTKTYIPKTIVVVGSGMFNSTTVTVGEAEGGLKITFARINDLNLQNLTLSSLIGASTYSGNGTESTGMIKTAFHEFAHILTQTKPLPEEFSLITPNQYLGDDWNTTGTTPRLAWTAGFPTKYSRHSPGEDFAEIVSIYTTRGATNWNDLLAAAGTSGASIINTKVAMINKYLQISWGTNLQAMREAFEARAARLNELDLVTL